ncbi:glycoside hydrolase family 79 protein [Hypholoma sublateritium FD-334 SS-4]|uniref:Glycoside hydrolase family 79 protein n=1 Tax=Hypholoma sublateritium (strain FD-334 SS-4) TaxID=945553 RepID=A0A0D2NIH9_HYPSF|nr:glycoside hydrolase family 79 protein [Hypholoma sublateritium FD-334 SS-4]
MQMSTSYLILSVLTVFSAFNGAHASSPASLNVTFPENPPASALMNVIEDHFIGVSFELSPFDTLWGESVSRQPTAMQNYMHNLAARMSKPLRIRIGGNGMDGSTYIPTMTSVLEQAEADPYFNDIPVNFGPMFFEILNGMADKVGPMQFLIGLSMRTPDNFTNVETLASTARQLLGDRLDALLLGNEPDLYAGHGERDAYNISAYIPEIGVALESLKGIGAIAEDEKIVGGPTTCCSWTLYDVLSAGLDQYPYKFYTLQHYPKDACSGEDPDNTNITYFTTHSNIESFVGWQTDGVNKAQKQGVPVLLTEYNSVACGGSNISATFATALWSIDAGLKSASMNYSAVYLHTREFGVQYNLFDPPTPETSTEPGWRTGSPYYGALFLAESTYEGGTIIIDLNLNNSITSPTATVAAYGIYNANAERASLALINYAGVSQVFVVPSGVAEKVQIKILTAPDVYEKTNISWAGQTVSTNGDLEGDLQIIEMSCKSGCQLTLPGPSAALVAFGDGILFSGNSTIASIGSYLSNAPTSSPLPHLSLFALFFGTCAMLLF